VHFVVEPADAVIELDGKRVDRDIQLAAGEYPVTVKQAGYKPWTRSVTVRGGESQTVNVSLERGIAHVSIDSDPRGLGVEVDGKASGYKTPASFDLPAGEHKLAVKGPTGEVWTEDLVATVDGKHAFTAMLRKPEQPVAANDKNDKKPKKPNDKDKKPPKPPEVVAEVKPPEKPPEVKPPEKPPEVVKPPEKPPAQPPAKPAGPLRTTGVAANAVTKLSGEIPKLKSAGGESNADAFVKMCIDETGKVTSVKVVRPTGAIAAELERAFATWRYKPYLNKDNQAQPVCFPLQRRLVFKAGD